MEFKKVENYWEYSIGRIVVRYGKNNKYWVCNAYEKDYITGKPYQLPNTPIFSMTKKGILKLIAKNEYIQNKVLHEKRRLLELNLY